MADYSLKINGVERQVLLDSFDLQMVANGVNTLRIDLGSEDASYRPAIDDEVIFKENGIAIFGGVITQPAEEAWDGPALEDIVTKVNAASFDVFATYRVVSEHFAPATLKTALQTLVTNYLTPFGVTLDPGQADGPILEVIDYTRTRLDSVLNDLAVRVATGSPNGEEFIWHIDASKKLKMWEAGSEVAPFDILDVGSPTQVGDLKITPTRDDTYANRLIVVFSGSGPATSTETFTVADSVSSGGYTRWTTKYPAMQDINTIWPNELYFDGVPMGPIAFGILDPQTGLPNLQSMGGLFGWAWDYLNHQLVYDEGGTGADPYASPNPVITVTYAIGYPFELIVEDVPAQAPPVYVHERVIEVQEGMTLAAAEAYANALLHRQSAVVFTAEYSTWSTGLRPGQTQTITQPKRDVDTTFILRNVNARIEPGANFLRYDVVALQGIPGSSYHLQNDPRQTYQDWLNGPAPKHLGTPPVTVPQPSAGPQPGGPDRAIQFNQQGGFGGSASAKQLDYLSLVGSYANPGILLTNNDASPGDSPQIALVNGAGTPTFIYSYPDGTFEIDTNDGESYLSKAPGDEWLMSAGLHVTGDGTNSNTNGNVFSVEGSNPASGGNDLDMIGLTPGAGSAGSVPAGQSAAGVLVHAYYNRASSGTHPLLTGLRVERPTIGGSAGATSAATVSIEGAPSVGSGKYALQVDADVSYFGGPLEVVGTAFANLPTPVTGMLAVVTNSTTNVWGATITGGGGNVVLAFYNGSNWTVAGK